MKGKTRWVLALALTASVVISAPAQAILIDRGGGLIYDDVLDLTWLQNASLGGSRTWDDAVAWADSLVFGGFADWRLPSISRAGGLPTGSSAAAVECSSASEMECRDNEMGYMFYHNLGARLGDIHTGNQGLIHNIQLLHWSGTEVAPMPAAAWVYSFSGLQGGVEKDNNGIAAWAVRPGDVLTAVPEPAAALLLALGLAILGHGKRSAKAVEAKGM